MKISIVVPTFNEEDNIKDLYDKITKVFKDIFYEIIFKKQE